MLVLSASLPSLRPAACSTPSCHSGTTTFQVAFFFSALYLVAFAGGGFKPCTQAFGADQFDPLDPAERKAMSSFFNWWYFGICVGTFLSLSTVIYIQDHLSWGLGFGIPCAAMAVGFFLFLLGAATYRHTTPMAMEGTKHVLSSGGETDESNYYGPLLQVLPIWATCLPYGIVFAQSQTFFTKQGSTLDRRIGSNFLIPPASVQILISFVIVSLIPAYDRIFVPVARYFTGIPSGITTLQRIGTGMVLSIVSMVVAAAVEARRLEVATDAGLVDEPGRTLPMSLWWLVPQYILFGVSDVFAVVGFQEFFYSEMPEETRSLGVAFSLSVFGVGNLLSGVLISVIDKVSRSRGGSWFSSNLNKAHLDYFYYLLASLSMFSMGVYIYLSKSRVCHVRRSVHKLIT